MPRRPVTGMPTTGYRIRIRRDCYGPNPIQDPLPRRFDAPVTIDLSYVDLFRPSGLAFVFALAFTAMSAGQHVDIIEPEPGVRRDYLRRTNFWSVLEQQGLPIPPDRRHFNMGESAGLIKPSIVTTTASTAENVQTSVDLFERFRRALEHGHLRDRERAASVFSELSLNAAEHSHSPHGAFVMAQVYPETHSIELAVADVGRGIWSALGTSRYASDAEAIQAAMSEDVTGRRDAAGNLAEGGYGLPTVAAEADFLAIRSGRALLKSHAERDERGELALTAKVVSPLAGTLVIASISTQR